MSAEPPPTASADRLDSWKEIAAYLGKAVRTVQRWESAEGLPVRRLNQDRPGSVFAYKAELDDWWQRQSGRLSEEKAPPPAAAPSASQSRPWLLAGGLALAAAIIAAAITQLSRTPHPANVPIPFTTDHGWETQPGFSPDGRQIAYVARARAGLSFVYVKAVGADAPVRLTGGSQPERSPVWSPDGRMIAFQRRLAQAPNGVIVLIPAAGGRETVVGELESGGPMVWSPDGHWFLSMESTERNSRIVAVAAATGQKQEVLGPSEFGYSGFGLSPDQKRLIFRRAGPGAFPVEEISLDALMRPTGTPRTLLPKIWMHEAIITADAGEIIYTDGSNEEDLSLWRSRLVPGAEPQLIHRGWSGYSSVAISQDKRRIAFAANKGVFRNETWNLHLESVPPKAEPFLTTTHSDMNPSYSPDGRLIAFHSTRTGASDIWISDRDGKNPRRLTYTNARTTATPRWSPDGSRIAFESNESGQSEVYVIRSNGGPTLRLTQNSATDAIPGWSRDGQWLYFCSDRTGRFEIWKVPAAGGPEVQVTRDGGFSAMESPDGKYLYYTQTRSRGPLLRIPLAGGDTEIIDSKMRGLFFAVRPNGVYYYAQQAIWRWNPATKVAKELYRPNRSVVVGLAVSPDEKELLFTQDIAQETDLYLIDGLR